ncbi:sensor histidine kinase [Hyphomicrobium denitrificans]|uniref:sensor histidine kinase n=1 Tax=Hyphomicrobium denitrificans TaxID=53399 RepID=UPI001FCBEEB1|nr:HAMP domain-containing sensor histidine kinase [Hyphomicrobium denitrificans]
MTANRVRSHAPLKALLHAGSRDVRRGPLLMLSALLTAIGIAVLNFDSQSLATVLLVAGAGLAAALILSSGHASTAAVASNIRNGAASCHATSSRFPELLVQSQSNAGLDRAAWAKLTAHMSHELRTPLNAVLGFSELMSKEIFGPLGSSAYGDYARDIHASGRMLLKSAEDALAITALLTAPSRKEAPRPCYLKSIVDEACAFAEYDLASRAITIETDVDAGVEIIGDPQATRQMLINLVAEASRNACSGAVVRIGACATNDTAELSIALSGQESCQAANSDDFAMILARTLCELSNAQLTVTDTSAGVRSWAIQFLAATQNDLFSGRA